MVVLTRSTFVKKCEMRVEVLLLGTYILQEGMGLHPLNPGYKSWTLVSDPQGLELFVIHGAFEHGQSGRHREAVDVHVHRLVCSAQEVPSVQVFNEELLEFRQI